LYIAPSPAGTGDGSDWRNAGPLERLSAFIAMAGPGGKVLLRADEGPYRISREIPIRAGGNDEAPVTVTGADSTGRPAKAEIVGSRSDPWTPDGKSGSDVFRLYTGANNLRFEQVLFRNQGNGCFRIANDVRGLEIQDTDARNVQRFVENYASGSAEGASVDGLTIRRVTVRGYSKGAIRLRSSSRSILIEDVIGDSERQDGDNFAEGIALEGTVHDAVIRRVAMMNSHDSTHEYWNGDGFVTERGVYNVLFEDTVASGFGPALTTTSATSRSGAMLWSWTVSAAIRTSAAGPARKVISGSGQVLRRVSRDARSTILILTPSLSRWSKVHGSSFRVQLSR
jgi:hypothetical protein